VNLPSSSSPSNKTLSPHLFLEYTIRVSKVWLAPYLFSLLSVKGMILVRINTETGVEDMLGPNCMVCAFSSNLILNHLRVSMPSPPTYSHKVHMRQCLIT
jgi:hypothetical protein